FVQAHGGGQSSCGIDGQDDCLPAVNGCLKRDRRGHGGLAHAAAAAADNDPFFFDEALELHARPPAASRSAALVSTSLSANWVEKMKGRGMTGRSGTSVFRRSR